MTPAPLRPQELVLAIALATLDERPSVRDLQELLGASSPSRVHDSLRRLEAARLVGRVSGLTLKMPLFHILKDAVRWLIPGNVGDHAVGVPTAHAVGPLANELVWQHAYVWPARSDDEQQLEGRSVEPLHDWAYGLAASNPQAHLVLALTDSIRVGRARDQQLAREHLHAALGLR